MEHFSLWFIDCSVFVDLQRDGSLSAGRSTYINYSGILQQFVQAYITKQQERISIYSI